MASGNYGILGAFTGTIGPVTGYLRNGKNVLRSSTSMVKDKATPRRMAQREKMRICSRFTKAFAGTGFFNKSFPAYGDSGTGFNRATGVLLNRALTGNYPNIYLNYAQVLISKGKLPGAENARAVRLKNGNIQFSFTNNSNTGTAAASDKPVLVAYAESLQQVIFSLDAGERKDGKAVLQTALFKSYTVETWIGFLNSDETNAADSVYTGSIVL